MTENPDLKPNKDHPEDSEQNGFLDTLPKELRDKEIFQGIEDVGQLARKAHELGGQVWDLNAGKPKVPETADGYEVAVPLGMPKEEALIEGFKTKAFETGMTQEQVSAVTDLWNSWISDQTIKQTEAMKAAEAKAVIDAESGLKDLWKENYETSMDAVMQVLHTFGTDEFKAELNQNGRGNSIHFTEFLHRIYSAMSEDAFVEGDPTPPKRMRVTRGGIPVLNFPSMENRG